MSLDELRRLYFELKTDVFHSPKMGLGCDTPALETLLKRTFGEATMLHCMDPKSVVGLPPFSSNSTVCICACVVEGACCMCSCVGGRCLLHVCMRGGRCLPHMCWWKVLAACVYAWWKMLAACVHAWWKVLAACVYAWWKVLASHVMLVTNVYSCVCAWS